MLQSKSKKIFTYLILFLILGTFNNKNFYKLNFPKIDSISIEGLDEKNNFQLANKLIFLKGNNLFFLKKKEIIEIINANSLVEKYSVFKIYPSSLDIKIDKTKFLAQLNKNNDIFLLGSNGKLTKINDDKKKSLPFIFGDFEISDFSELKKIINETNFNYDEIKNLFYFKSGRWDIETNLGILIKLPKNDIKKSLDTSVSLIAQDFQKKIKIIDLRQANQIIINDR